MSTTGRKDGLFIPALICAVLFVLTCWMWAYYANLFISLPLGLISLMLWDRGRKTDAARARYKWILYLLIFGSALSLGVLLTLLATN